MRIGLTGGIGSGKSSVSAMLHKLGAVVIDSDAIARRMTDAGGAAIPAMRREFGDTILTPAGALDRPAMRAMAFSDPAAKHRLEAVLHPLIAAEAQREAAAAMNRVVVFDVPLLAESRDWRERVDRVLVIDCSNATQVERVSRRPGWTRESAEQVIGGQARRSVRRAIADAVIFNDGITIDRLEFEVRALWSLWRPQQ